MSYNMEEDGAFEIYAFGKILVALEGATIVRSKHGGSVVGSL